MKQADPRDDNLVQSLQRGLKVLETLAAAEAGETLKELAAALGLKQATAYKLVNTLVASGYVEKTERPVLYTLGPGVLSLSDSYWQRSLLRRAEAVVEDLAARFARYRPTVVLTEAVGGEVETVLRASGERPGVLERPRGRVMPPYASACSLVLQAFWSANQREDYQTRHPFWEEGEYLWQTPGKLEAALAEVRARGYAQPVLEGRNVHLVAAPIFAANRRPVAALGLSLHDQEITDEDWAEQVQQVVQSAAALSAAE